MSPDRCASVGGAILHVRVGETHDIVYILLSYIIATPHYLGYGGKTNFRLSAVAEVRAARGCVCGAAWGVQKVQPGERGRAVGGAGATAGCTVTFRVRLRIWEDEWECWGGDF